ncbi:distal tail protein Dit [Sporosarcina sp. FSL K6-5500]|uniref:distal tail protein Dit n=1 Tax=Sporosarcina sp. FSL K6-5500 TaxID=2921558 RepID=UPI0030F693AF
MIVGLTFNGIHCRTLGLTMTASRRPILPESKDTYIDIPHRNGSILIADKSVGDIIVEADFTIVKDTTQNLYSTARLVGAWLSTIARKPLVFDDDPTYIYSAKVISSLTIEQVADFESIGDFTVSFRCSLPQGEE